jgi:hypothetical protein
MLAASRWDQSETQDAGLYAGSSGHFRVEK